MQYIACRLLLAAIVLAAAAARSGDLPLPVNRWVKLSPLAGTPPSPRLGYEGACAWDSLHQRMIRYGGHNQGGGGEQNSEIWSFNPLDARWALHEPNLQPPGICCGQQNLFDPVAGRYIRLPAFSHSHGWQWMREIYLNNSSVWTYDLEENRWRDMRPVPTANPRPLRCASWDTEHQVLVLFGGEGSHEGTWVYDPALNQWTKMSPPLEPAARSGGNMAYDSAARLHILFGSQFSNDPHTWGYDLRANLWRDLKPPVMPPTDKNDAVLAYDSRNRVVIAIIKQSTGEDEQARHSLATWAYHSNSNQWTRLHPPAEPDPSGNRARQLMFSPELNAVLLENRTENPRGEAEQQVWAYRYGDGAPEEPRSAGLNPRTITTSNSVHLEWEAPPNPPAGGYQILRGQGATPWSVAYLPLAEVQSGTRYHDLALNRGELLYYRIRPIRGTPGPEGLRVSTLPGVVTDLVVSVLTESQVGLDWTPPRHHEDIAGYKVERALVEVLTEDQLTRLKVRTAPLENPSVGVVRRIGPFQLLTDVPLPEPGFTDRIDLTRRTEIEGEASYQRDIPPEQIDPKGKPYRYAVYAYRVRAVNRLGVTGGPSPATLTIPSPVQHLFASEEGESCRLKWAGNPEERIAGYRVYRLNGRYDKEEVPRLTETPLNALQFTDPNAGDRTRRYHVIAVDALGQEGFPSSPVWSNREWRRFYEPFVGPWHQ